MKKLISNSKFSGKVYLTEIDGKDIDLPLGDLVPNIISEEKANKLSDLFANNLSKR